MHQKPYDRLALLLNVIVAWRFRHFGLFDFRLCSHRFVRFSVWFHFTFGTESIETKWNHYNNMMASDSLHRLLNIFRFSCYITYKTDLWFNLSIRDARTFMSHAITFSPILSHLDAMSSSETRNPAISTKYHENNNNNNYNTIVTRPMRRRSTHKNICEARQKEKHTAEWLKK